MVPPEVDGDRDELEPRLLGALVEPPLSVWGLAFFFILCGWAFFKFSFLLINPRTPLGLCSLPANHACGWGEKRKATGVRGRARSGPKNGRVAARYEKENLQK